MFLPAAVLLASIIIGPETTPPAAVTTPARAYGSAVAALHNGNFLVVWGAPPVIAAQVIDRTTGAPVRRTLTPIGSGGSFVTVAALGDRVLAVWDFGGQLRWALLDAGARVLNSGGADVRVDSLAVTTIGNRYLVAWRRGYDDIDGMFIDADGRAAGSPIPLVHEASLDGGFALASNGSRALIAAAAYGAVSTLTVDAGGRVKHGTTLTRYASGIHAAWDGAGYLLSWRESALVLAWVDAQGHPVGSPWKFAEGDAGSSMLVPTSPGVTLFMRQADKANVVARFGMGGNLLGSILQTLPVAFDSSYDMVHSAAFDGLRYYVAGGQNSLQGATTDLVSPATAVPLAFTAHDVWEASIAVGDHQSFVGWSEGIARFRDGAFSGTTAVYATALAADGDGVMAFTGDSARFLDAGGAVVSSLALPPASPWAAARLPSGNFLAAGLSADRDSNTLLAAAFDRTHVLASRSLVPYIGANGTQPFAALSGTAGLVAWVDDRGRSWLAHVDGTGTRLGTALQLDAAGGDSPWFTIAVANDGHGHALVATTAKSGDVNALSLVDLASMRVERRTEVSWPPGAHLAWTGEEYLFVSERVEIATIAANGVPTGEPAALPEPYPPFGVRLASGPAGTLILYLRTAADLGYGDARRPFVREVKAVRRHAAGR